MSKELDENVTMVKRPRCGRGRARDTSNGRERERHEHVIPDMWAWWSVSHGKIISDHDLVDLVV